MNEKTASVHWTGKGKEGKGTISTETGALKNNPYGFASRFENDRRGTNPEELLGAAHAACFTMAFSFACDKAGFATKDIDTRARVRLVTQGGGFLTDRNPPRVAAAVPRTAEAARPATAPARTTPRVITANPAAPGSRTRHDHPVLSSPSTIGTAKPPSESAT